MSQKELRSAVQRYLKVALPEKTWSYLEKENFVSEAQTEHKDPVAWLAGRAKELLDLSEAEEPVPQLMPRRRQRRYKSLPLRLEVISDLMAAKARADERVQVFRAQHLPPTLLTPTKAVEWIEEKRDEGDGYAIIINVPKTVALELRSDGWRCEPPLSAELGIRIENLAPAIVLEFATPQSAWVHRMPVARDGVLRTLHDLAEGLASAFSWQRAQATTFVLTDWVPVLRGDSVAFQPGPIVKLGTRGTRSLNCLERFVITVDSRTSPPEVAELYAQARAKHLRRSRALGIKHMTLAGFSSQYDVLNQAVMADWNRSHPDWKYGRFSLFARDARAAAERLLFSSVVNSRSLKDGLPKK